MPTATRWLALLVCLVGPRGLMSQEVRGQVRDRATGAGVSNGVVTLVDAVDGRLLGHVAVGPQGQYAFRVPRPGAYLLQFVGPGYGPFASGEFTLAPGETRIVPLPAASLPAAVLDTVVVAGRRVTVRLQRYHERRAAGVGEFITREQIDRLSPVVTTDILQQTAGVNVVRVGPGLRVASRQDPATCARTDQPSGPLVFLDGLFLGNGMGLNLDGLLMARAIEAVEVYSGAGDVPPEFERSGAECGVVGLWTRAAAPEPIAVPVFEAGGQFGTWVTSQGLAEGRFGGRIVIGFTSGVEMMAAVSRLVLGLETGTAGTDRTGTQVTVAARVRPLGRQSSLYVGAGGTFLSFQRSLGIVDDEEYFFLMAGLVARKGRFRPFLETQVLDPVGEPQIHAYTGVTIRLY